MSMDVPRGIAQRTMYFSKSRPYAVDSSWLPGRSGGAAAGVASDHAGDGHNMQTLMHSVSKSHGFPLWMPAAAAGY